jgi:anti-sigma regulatory factor (Ser/Thr protein kinase)
MIIEVSELSQAGEARRKVVAYADDLKMGETRLGEIALVTTELATNLAKHAKQGYILAQRVGQSDKPGLRVMGIDKGPGIADIPRALSDGHSTAGSMGTGLGAIRRLSDHFEIYSVPGSGTVISTEFWQGVSNPASRHHSLEIAVLSEPIRGEEECGDGWGWRSIFGTVLLMVVDGLGHGVLAAEAAREAERVFAGSRELSLAAMLSDTHNALRKTRGAAEAIAKIELDKDLLSFAGVGNITASIISPGSSRSMASHNSTLGMNTGRVQEFTCPWNKDSVLIMHSDGLATRWDLRDYPGIWSKAPSVIAAVLHGDFCRQWDDVTVLVAKATEVSGRIWFAKRHQSEM